MAGYKDLLVWHRSMDLVEEVYRLIRFLPKEENYALADQMRRSAVSIPSNIAEGHGRESITDFKRFILIAQGSRTELETQLEICIRLKYLTQEQVKPAFELSYSVGKMLFNLVRGLNKAT